MELVRREGPSPAGWPAPLVFGRVAPVTDATDRHMPTEDEIDAWMRAVARSADRPAFAELFRHFAPRIKGFLKRGGASDALAEELTQETMVVMWRRAATFDSTRAQVSTWLYTIARNLRIDYHRRAPGGPAEPPSEWDAEQQPADAHLTPDELLHSTQREDRVRQALAELPPEQAQLLRLSFFDEHAHGRIAQDLGIPLGTVKSRIRRAVIQLRHILERNRT
ncbi:MAG: sigma-70 family RNA polymerase sigma factor [Gammaproteobacteria bacterium]